MRSVAVRAGGSSPAAAGLAVGGLLFLVGPGEGQGVGVERATVDCNGVFITVPPAVGLASGTGLAAGPADGLLPVPPGAAAPDVGELLLEALGDGDVGLGDGDVGLGVGLTVWLGDGDAGGELDWEMVGGGVVAFGVAEQAGGMLPCWPEPRLPSGPPPGWVWVLRLPLPVPCELACPPAG